MAEVELEDVTLLVAHLSANGTEWQQTIHARKTAGGPLTDTDTPVEEFHDFCRLNCPNAGFLESISGYRTFQRKKGETNVEHPPVFTNVYHEAGQHDTAYNGSPLGLPLPKDVVVYARLATSGGRSGKMFIRNCMEEGDVESVLSGVWSFNALSSRFTPARFATVVTDTIADLFTGGAAVADHQFVVAHLLLVEPTDTRSAFATTISSCTAIRPTWNRAHR